MKLHSNPFLCHHPSYLPPFLPPLLLSSSPHCSSPETQLELEKNLSTAKEELSTASMKLRAMIRAFKESLIYQTPPSGTEHTGRKSFPDHCILQPHSQTTVHSSQSITYSSLIPRPLHTPVSFPVHCTLQLHSQTFTYSFPYTHTHTHTHTHTCTHTYHPQRSQSRCEGLKCGWTTPTGL